jgi:phosphohistidine phosphatase SixA
MRITTRLFVLIVSALALIGSAYAQTLSGTALAAALKQGGYVIVMRHASSPREVPTKAGANTDNVNLERQLDEAGRTTATAMGKAMRELKIPIGEVLTSPTYRAMETIRLAQWSNPKSIPELGEGGQNMQAASNDQGKWLQDRITQTPGGTNTILITHMPNLTRAFPQITAVADGEALIFHPDGKGGAPLVARIKIEEWPNLRP